MRRPAAAAALALLLALVLLPATAQAAPAATPDTTCTKSTKVGDNSGEATGKCPVDTPGDTSSGGSGGGRAVVYPYLFQFCGTNKVNPALNDPATSYRVTSTAPIQFRGESGIVGFYYYDSRPGHGVTTAEDANYVQATVECFDSRGALLFTSLVVIPRGAVVIIDPIALRDEARARITIGDPPIVTNPPWDDPDRFGVVRVPTWLWLEPGYWVPKTEGAAQGPVAVTVTATPQVATWTPGDGSTVVCAGPGVPWRAGLAESATDCSHTYLTSSARLAGAHYRLDVSVRWEFTWTLNGVDQGPFGTVTVAAPPIAYPVGEIQAVGAAAN